MMKFLLTEHSFMQVHDVGLYIHEQDTQSTAFKFASEMPTNHSSQPATARAKQQNTT